jgi:hypothetical protein
VNGGGVHFAQTAAMRHRHGAGATKRLPRHFPGEGEGVALAHPRPEMPRLRRRADAGRPRQAVAWTMPVRAMKKEENASRSTRVPRVP